MNALRKVIRNCRQATLLIEKQTTDKLSVKEFLSLRLHLLFCSFCRMFKKQSTIINQMVQQLYSNAELQAPKLDSQFKVQLEQHINEALKE